MDESIESTFRVKRGNVLRNKPWVVSTFVLGILILVLLAGNLSGITGNTISSSKVGALALDFANTKLLSVDATLDSVKKISGLYQVNLNIEDEIIPLYFTKDGNYVYQGSDLVSIIPEEEINSNTNTQTATEIPKSDKPVVELFIWAYCPYGVQAQGPVAEVVNLLGKYADFKAVMYYNGHGDYETQQNKIQECIQELYPTKYWKYAAGFVKDVYPACSSVRTVDCDKTESVKLMKSLGIDSAKVLSCVESKGDNLLSTAFNYAKENGVSGSPTLIINGVKVSAQKNAEAYKSAVCSAFNNAPEECSTTLSGGTTAASGNC